MNKITIIGTGNVASHLCVAMAGKVCELINVSSRTLEDLPLDSDLYIISVSDDAIQSVAASLPELNGIVAHTSGSVGMEVLAPYAKRYGVFYPLQTFTKGLDINYAEIPMFIEGCDEAVAKLLSEAAALFTSRIYPADSQRRRRLHVAAVFACNYANYMWSIADRLLREDDMTFDLLRPLISGAVDKVMRISPEDAQTGPASRGDIKVLQEHYDMLGNTSEGNIYRNIGEAILNERGFLNIKFDK